MGWKCIQKCWNVASSISHPFARPQTIFQVNCRVATHVIDSKALRFPDQFSIRIEKSSGFLTLKSKVEMMMDLSEIIPTFFFQFRDTLSSVMTTFTSYFCLVYGWFFTCLFILGLNYCSHILIHAILWLKRAQNSTKTFSKSSLKAEIKCY